MDRWFTIIQGYSQVCGLVVLALGGLNCGESKEKVSRNHLNDERIIHLLETSVKTKMHSLSFFFNVEC